MYWCLLGVACSAYRVIKAGARVGHILCVEPRCTMPSNPRPIPSRGPSSSLYTQPSLTSALATELPFPIASIKHPRHSQPFGIPSDSLPLAGAQLPETCRCNIMHCISPGIAMKQRNFRGCWFFSGFMTFSFEKRCSYWAEQG